MSADSKSLDPVLKYCAVGRQLGYAGYLTLDAVTVVDVVGIRRFEGAKRVQREAYRCWMVGLVFSAVSGVYGLYQLRLQQGRIEKTDGEGVVASKRIERYACPYLGEIGYRARLTDDRERAALNLQLLSDLCDLTVPTSAIGLASFDDGFVGLAGTLSSLIGVYAQWKKTA